MWTTFELDLMLSTEILIHEIEYCGTICELLRIFKHWFFVFARRCHSMPYKGKFATLEGLVIDRIIHHSIILLEYTLRFWFKVCLKRTSEAYWKLIEMCIYFHSSAVLLCLWAYCALNWRHYPNYNNLLRGHPKTIKCSRIGKVGIHGIIPK